ncbi:MAG: hypothetical protein AAB705_01975 [Patescibacteria group bacterium]
MKQQEKIIFILIFAFLFLNLIYSQFISPIYFKLVNNNKGSTITFLQKIKDLPEYQNILDINSNIYGPAIKQEIHRQENQKKEVINNIEQQLLINPKSRDVLYSLYQLYLAEGDKNKAGEYLKRAKEVDPNIK